MAYFPVLPLIFIFILGQFHHQLNQKFKVITKLDSLDFLEFFVLFNLIYNLSKRLCLQRRDILKNAY
jgi:hypothetical protein